MSRQQHPERRCETFEESGRGPRGTNRGNRVASFTNRTSWGRQNRRGPYQSPSAVVERSPS